MGIGEDGKLGVLVLFPVEVVLRVDRGIATIPALNMEATTVMEMGIMSRNAI